MDAQDKIASIHLGKASDGTTVQPYVTPDKVDCSLLVPIPRILNREQYNIDDNKLPFVGFDTWNCYEFSCLNRTGFPISGHLKIIYPANSKYIVESKSLKLYLNSYNMDVFDTNTEIQDRITLDLNKALQINDVKAKLFIGDQDYVRPFKGITFTPLESLVDTTNTKFNHYNESPSILISKTSHEPYMAVKSYSLRSNCRVTNQPDWGDVYIYINGPIHLEYDSLLQYIVSMRKENHFHEEICECIYKRLLDQLKPVDLFVGCLYTRRGGIDINPVRASNYTILDWIGSNLEDENVICEKTLRQ